MDKSKSLSLTAQIFNKLSTKSFISKTCEKHQSLLPIYICKGCLNQNGSLFCQECFNGHTCSNKSRGEISQWIFQIQQGIVKSINNTQRQYDTIRLALQPGKIKIQSKIDQNQSQNTILQINGKVLSKVQKILQKCQKQIQQEYLKPALEGSMKLLFESFLSGVKLSLNGLSDKLPDMKLLAQNCDKKGKQTQQQIKKELIQIKQKCSVYYGKSLKKYIQQMLNQICIQESLKDSLSEGKNSKQNYLLYIKSKQLQKQIELLRENELSLQSQIFQLQDCIKNEKKKFQQKQKQNRQNLNKYEQQIEQLKNKASKTELELKKAQSLLKQLQQKNSTINVLQNRCKDYQVQLAQAMRDKVGIYQKPQHRYDMEDAANRISQLSQKCQNLIIQGGFKDRKITQLISQINKMKLKSKQGKSPYSSGRKQSTQ